MFIVTCNGRTQQISGKDKVLLNSSKGATMFETKVAARSAIKRTRRWMNSNQELFYRLTGTEPKDNEFAVLVLTVAE